MGGEGILVACPFQMLEQEAQGGHAPLWTSSSTCSKLSCSCKESCSTVIQAGSVRKACLMHRCFEIIHSQGRLSKSVLTVHGFCSKSCCQNTETMPVAVGTNPSSSLQGYVPFSRHAGMVVLLMPALGLALATASFHTCNSKLRP